jgi:hypothetical protein
MQRKFIFGLVLVVFIANTALPYGARAQSLNLPGPGQLLLQSSSYSLPALKGLKLDSKDPLKIDFIIDTANQGKVSKEEAAVLIRYFMAGIAMPDKDIWVNLSPYEQDRVVPQALGETDLGRDLLAEDYVLKQLAASLTYPETEQGKKYWQAINGYTTPFGGRSATASSRAEALTQLSLTKVWIIPGKAKVYEHQNLVMVKDATLKVMMEEDYLAAQKNNVGLDLRVDPKQNNTTNAFKTHILPLIEQDVNTGKNFAQLRQIYSALILAKWFKEKFKASFYRHYINSANNKGIDISDKDSKDKIYAQYVEAFQKGVYNYVKTERERPLTPSLAKRGNEVGALALVKRGPATCPELSRREPGRVLGFGTKITKRAYFSGGAEPMPAAVESEAVTAGQTKVGSLGPLTVVPVSVGNPEASKEQDIAKVAGGLAALIAKTGLRDFTIGELVVICENRSFHVGLGYLEGISEAWLQTAVDELYDRGVLTERYGKRPRDKRGKYLYSLTGKKFDPQLYSIDKYRQPNGQAGEHPGKNPRDVARLIEDLSLEAFTIRELQAHYQRNAARLGYDLPAALTTLRKDLDKLVVRGFLEIKANGGGYNKEYTYARTDMLLDDYLQREPVQAVKDIVNSVSRKFFRNIRRGYKGEARAEYYFHGIAGKKMPFRAFKAKVIEAIAAAQITDLGEVKRLVEKVFENISYFNDRPDKGSGRPYCIDIRFEHALGLLSGSEFKRSPREDAGFQDWLKKDEAGQVTAALFAWLGIKRVTSFRAAADAITDWAEDHYRSMSKPVQYQSWEVFYSENDAGVLLSRLAKELKVEFNAKQSPVYAARAIAEKLEAVGGINMSDIALEVSPGTVPAEFNGITADFFKRMNFTIFNLRNNLSFDQLLR